MQTNRPWLSRTARRPRSWEETKRLLRLIAGGALLAGLIGSFLEPSPPSQDAQLEHQTAQKAQSLPPLLLW